MQKNSILPKEPTNQMTYKNKSKLRHFCTPRIFSTGYTAEDFVKFAADKNLETFSDYLSLVNKLNDFCIEFVASKIDKNLSYLTSPFHPKC